jgi:hopene-associated glycosyltransferase HpnB
LYIFVVDDHSSDGTAETARKAADEAGFWDRLTVIDGAALPAGWTGKLWAVHQGVEQALLIQPKFLLLTDADIYHSSENLARLLTGAGRGQYDLTSLMVRLHCEAAAERLLIPAFVFFFFLLYPPEWIRDPQSTTAGAAGGCMLVRPKALARIGGIPAIRGEIIDDCALARAVKCSGGKVWLGLTADTTSLRGYESFDDISQMIARTAFNQLRHSSWLLVGAVAGLILTYLVPLALLVSGYWPAALLGSIAYLMMSLSYLPMVRFYGLSSAWALTMPLAAVFYMVSTVRSAFNYWSGRGGEWKGRVQDVQSSVDEQTRRASSNPL